MAVGLVAYLWPKKTIEVQEFTVNEPTYKTGDIIFGTLRATIERRGYVINDIYLQCGSSRYFLKEVSYTIPHGTNSIITVPLGAVPADVYPPDCRIQADSDLIISILPGLHRTYEQTIYSNNFRVTN